MIPIRYEWLNSEPAPAILKQALSLYGVVEKPGSGSNSTIISWGKEVEAVGYSDDSIPWCGLFISVCAKRAGLPYKPGGNALWARNWASWGNKSDKPMLGDVLVFSRPGGGGHVALYVGEDATAYYTLGGNQSDSVCVTKMAKGRLIAARRTVWKVRQPDNIRVVRMSSSGEFSKNEA